MVMNVRNPALSMIGLMNVALTATSVLAQNVNVSPQEIEKAWVGKTVVGAAAAGPAAGKMLEMQLRADGTAEVSGAATDTGVWRLSEQGYCATWKKIRNGQERCFTVQRLGSDWRVINPDGSLNTIISQIR
ncbi:MAG: hypothetical protein IPN53_14135 [Comamonadaceae bacterium]|nr:hypothetical protein [Comamonadaceae bacterium]